MTTIKDKIATVKKQLKTDHEEGYVPTWTGKDVKEFFRKAGSKHDKDQPRAGTMKRIFDKDNNLNQDEKEEKLRELMKKQAERKQEKTVKYEAKGFKITKFSMDRETEEDDEPDNDKLIDDPKKDLTEEEWARLERGYEEESQRRTEEGVLEWEALHPKEEYSDEERPEENYSDDERPVDADGCLLESNIDRGKQKEVAGSKLRENMMKLDHIMLSRRGRLARRARLFIHEILDNNNITENLMKLSKLMAVKNLEKERGITRVEPESATCGACGQFGWSCMCLLTCWKCNMILEPDFLCECPHMKVLRTVDLVKTMNLYLNDECKLIMATTCSTVKDVNEDEVAATIEKGKEEHWAAYGAYKMNEMIDAIMQERQITLEVDWIDGVNELMEDGRSRDTAYHIMNRRHENPEYIEDLHGRLNLWDEDGDPLVERIVELHRRPMGSVI